MISAEQTEQLLQHAQQGDQSAVGELFSCHRERLQRFVQLRLDPRLQGRVDASDVLQDVFLEASQRLPEYLRERTMPFYLWLRFLTGQCIKTCFRRHLRAGKRDARLELPLHGGIPPANSESLAAHLLAQATSPSGALIRAELQRKLQEVLEKLRPLDREVLVLRHFEQLSNQETALALNIDPSAASTRYIRALQRLKQALEQIPGFFDEWTGRKSGGAPGGRVGRSRSLPGHGTQEAGGDG